MKHVFLMLAAIALIVGACVEVHADGGATGTSCGGKLCKPNR